MLTDAEIYDRTVNEMPFTAEEKLEKTRYWSQRTVQERLTEAYEILRRHYRKQGIDVDSLRMDKTIVRRRLLQSSEQSV